MSDPETKPPGGERDREEAQAFRVIDRRRFAPDGTERSEGESQGPGVESKPGVDRPTSDRPEAGGGADFVMSEGDRRRAEPRPEPTLSTLLLSLSTQALMHLGEIPDLATGKPSRDLPAARGIIDLLAVLEHKTRGNLDSAEAALLERILYDLRMRFVELSRS